MDEATLSQLEARLVGRLVTVLREELAALGIDYSVRTDPVAPRKLVTHPDLVDFWVNMPEEEWKPKPLVFDFSDTELWWTVKEAQAELGRSETFVRELVRKYPIAVMYRGQLRINRWRAIAAMYGNLAPKKDGNR